MTEKERALLTLKALMIGAQNRGMMAVDRGYVIGKIDQIL